MLYNWVSKDIIKLRQSRYFLSGIALYDMQFSANGN